MIESPYQDIFSIPDADAICVTTNGQVKANGELVMGAGIAKEFARRFPWLPKHLGTHVKCWGNIPAISMAREDSPKRIISFPTKDNCGDPSDLALIETSARLLLAMADTYGLKRVYMPRPGCGLGGLDWETVRMVIAPILDDRFIVLGPK